MKTKLFTTVPLVLVLVFTLAWTAGTVSAEPVCDPDYVTQSGGVFSVAPTGVDDTANLQCAFDAAVAYGAGAQVKLVEGTFYTGQIVVYDFQGVFSGAGMDRTLIYNLPNLYVTPEDYYINPPSAENPGPILFTFVDGDFNISDFALYIVGDTPTTEWTIWGFSPAFRELAAGIHINGTESNANVDRILIEGEFMESGMFGYNLINGVFIEGFIGEPPLPISGNFSVQNSIFRRTSSGTPLANIADAHILISHNTYEEVTFAMDGGTFTNSYIEFSHNNSDAVIGVDFYDFYAPMDIGSSFVFRNNSFRGYMGIALEQTFGEGNQCLIIGNNLQQLTDIGIYLGPGTVGCTVVGGGAKTSVLDLGTDNILTGVNNMGVGIGPDISHLMRNKTIN